MNQSTRLPKLLDAPVRVAVVIVHYRTPDLLTDCIDSLLPEIDPARDRVLVVDNASDDGSLKTLQRMRGITLIESEKNLGFAGANNLAIRQVEAAYYLLLNPDTVVRPGAIAKLLAFLQTHPSAAVVGPRLEYPDGAAQLSAFRYPNPVGELLRGASLGVLSRRLRQYDVLRAIAENAEPADWLAGACLLARRDVFETVGLLDDRYFMYFEEVDFCRRAARMGFACWYLPDAHVVHLVGRASGVVAGQRQKRLPGYWFDSRHRYFRTHFGYFGTLLADMLWFAGFLLMRMRRLLTGSSPAYTARREGLDFLWHESRGLLRRL